MVPTAYCLTAYFLPGEEEQLGVCARLQVDWAVELSEVKQGLGVTRLIFNTDRSEVCAYI